MTIWVKICGLTTSEAVDAALDAGADAIGFVFAESKRRVTPQRAAELARHAKVPRVAVMLHPTQAMLDEVWSVFRPDVLQTDLDDLVALRLPQELSVMPVVRSNSATPASVPSRLLFEGAVSGAGKTADWDAAAKLARTTQLVLAGGLNASNVAAAITSVAPFGVDVSSGVEAAPGVKDPMKIHEFVRNARASAYGANR
jgi:phosphoribosylanthranilate isomerase